MEPQNPKVVTDVEKPGTTPAHATSRPLINRRASVVKDPMVSQDKVISGAQDPVLSAPSVTKKKIQPLDSQDEPAAEKAAVESQKSSGFSKDAPLPDELTHQSADEVAAAAQVALSKEDQQQSELVAKLAEEKKYFVPIGAVQKRRTARVTFFLAMVLILLLTTGILAIDAEIVETNVTLPFDLIKSAAK